MRIRKPPSKLSQQKLRWQAKIRPGETARNAREIFSVSCLAMRIWKPPSKLSQQKFGDKPRYARVKQHKTLAKFSVFVLAETSRTETWKVELWKLYQWCGTNSCRLWQGRGQDGPSNPRPSRRLKLELAGPVTTTFPTQACLKQRMTQVFLKRARETAWPIRRASVRCLCRPHFKKSQHVENVLAVTCVEDVPTCGRSVKLRSQAPLEEEGSNNAPRMKLPYHNFWPPASRAKRSVTPLFRENFRIQNFHGPSWRKQVPKTDRESTQLATTLGLPRCDRNAA